MRRQFTLSFVPGLAAAAVFAWGCDRAGTPASPQVPKPSFWVGCFGGEKFTGGGRIDPAVGKTTFGFNVHAGQFCTQGGDIKGQLQVVNHPLQILVHSTSIDFFSSYDNPDFSGGRCAEFSGTARVKQGNASWTYGHHFEVKTCDNGEPGSSPGKGPDTFGVSVSGVGATGETPLTGGNIQAH